MIDGGIHCSCWMDTEEHLQCRRERYRLKMDRKTPEEVERRRHRNWEYMPHEIRHWRAVITAEKRRLQKTRNVKVNTSTWNLVCVIIHSLTWTSYLSWQALLEYHWIISYVVKRSKWRYHRVGKFGKFTLFEHLAKESLMNRSANRLLIVSTNFSGFSLANHGQFTKFAKLPHYTVLHTNMLCQW